MLGRSALVLAAVLAFIGSRSDGIPFDPDSTEPIPKRHIDGSMRWSCGDIVSPIDYGYGGVFLNPDPVTPRQALARTIEHERRRWAEWGWRPTGTLYADGYDLLLMSGDRLHGWFTVSESYQASGEWKVVEFHLCR